MTMNELKQLFGGHRLTIASTFLICNKTFARGSLLHRCLQFFVQLLPSREILQCLLVVKPHESMACTIFFKWIVQQQHGNINFFGWPFIQDMMSF